MRHLIYVHTAGGFDWGWDSFVALGTLLLAISTGVLAWITRAVATKTGLVASKTQELAQETKQLAVETKQMALATASEVAAQHRPILVTQPGRLLPTVRAALAQAGNVDLSERPCGFNHNHQLWVALYNSGPGPALDIKALLDEREGAPRAASPWDSGALPSGGVARVFFDGTTPPQTTVMVTVSYRDIADKAYTSNILLERVGPFSGPTAELRVKDVRVEIG
jgi:hypothetical protein